MNEAAGIGFSRPVGSVNKFEVEVGDQPRAKMKKAYEMKTLATEERENEPRTK